MQHSEDESRPGAHRPKNTESSMISPPLSERKGPGFVLPKLTGLRWGALGKQSKVIEHDVCPLDKRNCGLELLAGKTFTYSVLQGKTEKV